MKVIKTVRALAAVAALSALSSVASAQTVISSEPVEVKVTLTSQCRLTGAVSGLTVDFQDYTAFQPGPNAGTTTTIGLECTRGFGGAPTITWDADDATEGSNGSGVIAGLFYNLTVGNAQTSAGTAPTAAGGAASGSPALRTFTLGGTMPGLQAGTHAGAEVTQNRTLTISF